MPIKGVTHKARVAQARKEFETRLRTLSTSRKIADFLVESAPRLLNSNAINGYLILHDGSLFLNLEGIDVPFVISELCAPIHQHFNVDWQMKANDYSQSVILTTCIPWDRIDIPKVWYHNGFSITITIDELDLQTCRFETIRVRQRTTEEVLEAAKNLEYETKRVIHCD